MKCRLSLSTMLIVFLTASLSISAENASPAGSNLGNVRGGDFKKAHSIIEAKCTQCHSKDKIDAALSSGKDMVKIQKDMEKRGAALNSKERDVLGIYWKQTNPLK